VGLTYLLTSQAGVSPEGAAAAAVLSRAAIVSSELIYVALGLLLTPQTDKHSGRDDTPPDEVTSTQTEERSG